MPDAVKAELEENRIMVALPACAPNLFQTLPGRRQLEVHVPDEAVVPDAAQEGPRLRRGPVDINPGPTPRHPVRQEPRVCG